MTSAARRWAVGAFGVVVALTVLPATTAGAADGAWEVLRWSVDPGDAVAGEHWTITGTISAPAPTDIITDVELTLTRVEDDESASCPGLTTTTHVSDGYGLGDPDDGATTTSTMAGPTTTSILPTGNQDRARFRFDVTPRCNGRYQLHVVGTADRLGLPDSVSDPLAMGDADDPDNAVIVNLRAPDVTGVQLAANPDRSVAVVWEAPEGYTTSPPPDFLGYGVDYSYDGGITWKDGALTEPTAHSAVVKVKPTEPAGTYQVRVRGVRKNADNTLDPAIVATGASTAVATVAIGAPPPPTTNPPSRGGGGSNGHVAPPGTAPPPTTDGGFEETLDYSDLEEGDEHAHLPDDASSFLDFTDSPGTAILVPFAIAECLAVWAFHLRILARRLESPTVMHPVIAVDTTRPGRTPT